MYNRDHEFDGEAYSGFPENELIYWKYNILWSLNQYEHVEKPLVVWDIISALLAFKQFAPKYIEHVIAKWLISWGGTQLGLNIEETLSQVTRLLSKISSHRLHLLNIISRRVVLAELQADNINCSRKNLGGVCGSEQHLALWLELLLSSESELRGRLVAISLSAVLCLVSAETVTLLDMH